MDIYGKAKNRYYPTVSALDDQPQSVIDQVIGRRKSALAKKRMIWYT